MKKLITLALFLSMLCGALAQHHATLTVENQQRERFFLYLNNQQQNTKSSDYVSVSELGTRGEYRVEVVMDNRERTSANVQVKLRPGDNRYVMEYDRREHRIMLRAIDKPAAPGRPQNGHDAKPPKPQPGNHADPHHQEPGHHSDNHKPQPGNHTDPHHQEPGHHSDNHKPQPAHQEGVVPPPPPAPLPCSDKDFQNAKHLVQQQDFESSKLKIAKQVAQSEMLTTSQIAEIARLFEFESTKLEFLKYAYAYCFDPNKYYLVNSVFEFDSSKNELDKFVEKNRR